MVNIRANYPDNRDFFLQLTRIVGWVLDFIRHGRGSFGTPGRIAVPIVLLVSYWIRIVVEGRGCRVKLLNP